MPSTTLTGVFPDPKPTYRRDFIKENVRSIKHMQGILQEAGVIQPRKTKPNHPALFKNIPRQIKSRENELRRGHIDLTQLKLSEDKSAKGGNSDLLDAKISHSEEGTAKPRAKHSNSNPNTSPSKSNSKSKVKSKPYSKSKLTKKNKKGLENLLQTECRFTETAVQTEREEDLAKLYQTGIIKYPTRNPSLMTKTDHSPKRPGNHGDYNPDPPECDIMEQFNTLGISDEKDFIHKNINNIKPKQAKQTSQKVLAQAPPGYKKGEVPKYLKDMKDHSIEELDEHCPPGHVMLPDEERRETLKVLRQSYAERIQELNMMPVRNDTLKMRKRKMDIEAELNRLDQGIKVFQRPKVYVKMDISKGS